MIKERKPYSVIGFKVDQISVLLGNLNVHINELEKLGTRSDDEVKALRRCLVVTQERFNIFEFIVDNLEEVKDGLV